MNDGAQNSIRTAVIRALLTFALLIYGIAGHAEAFRPGEKLIYEAHWGIVRAAQIQLEVARAPSNSGVPSGLLFRGECRSLGLVDTIYPIRSRVETLARASDFLPVLFTENRSEGKHRYERTMSFDFDTKIGWWKNNISGSNKRVRLPKHAYDQLTAFYALRHRGLQPGKRQILEVIADGRYEKLSYVTGEVRERTVGKWARMPTVEITSEDLMEKATRRKASMRMIVTADGRAIPLQVDLRASWGTVTLHLVEATGLVGQPLEQAATSTTTLRSSRGRRG